MNTGNKKRNKLQIYVDAGIRSLMLKGLANRKKSVLLTEYPKSGGTWVGQMVADSVGLPFPRNKIPMTRGLLFHGHYLKGYALDKTIVLWRDPRDIVVSWYHHAIIGNKHANPDMIKRYRARLDAKDVNAVAENLTKFIEVMFSRPVSPKFSWNDFFDAWHGNQAAVFTSYESFRHDPVTELGRVVTELGIDTDAQRYEEIVDRYSFDRLAGRKRGVEKKDSFLRKGIVGDWKNYFTQESLDLIYELTAGRMEKIGYQR